MNDKALRTLQANTATELFLAIATEEIEALADAIIAAQRIFVAGFGRAGNVVRILGMNCAQMGKIVFSVGDNNTPAIKAGDLLIIGSRSGSTKTMQIICTQAKEHGATIALISSDAASPIGKMAALNVVIPRIAVEAELPLLTKGLTYYQAAFILGDYMEEIIMRRLGLTYEDVMANHNNLE